MNPFIRKEILTVEEYFTNLLLAIYTFDPSDDFNRISRVGLLSVEEMSALKDEDHYLLTANAFEFLQWQWSQGKIKNLSTKIPIEEANEKLGFWLGQSLAVIYSTLTNNGVLSSGVKVSLENILCYLDELEGIYSKEEASLAMANLFSDRVLCGEASRLSNYEEKQYSLKYFAKHVLDASEYESQMLLKNKEVIYKK